jgi:hypothetical protein
MLFLLIQLYQSKVHGNQITEVIAAAKTSPPFHWKQKFLVVNYIYIQKKKIVLLLSSEKSFFFLILKRQRMITIEKRTGIVFYSIQKFRNNVE